MAVRIEKVAWGGWPNCYRAANDQVELIVTADTGPRIIRYAFLDGENHFLEIPDQFGQSGEPGFRPRGGHRLWTAPEQFPRTYEADNHPVAIEVQGATLIATAPVESCGIQKQLLVRMAGVGAAVTVIHRLQNALAWPIKVAAWALTMMAPGGVGITGFPPRGTHPEQLAPTHPLVMWAFTDLSDPRWTLTRKHVLLRQDAARPAPTKIGLFNERTWGGYWRNGELFLKRCDAESSRTYPDFGASYETFANGATLELETLSPLTLLDPGARLEHVERWSLHSGITFHAWTDEELDNTIGPLL